MSLEQPSIKYSAQGDIAYFLGRNHSDLVISFSSYQDDWESLRTPSGFDFLSSVIKGRNDGIFLRDVTNTWYPSGIPDAPGDVFSIVAHLSRFVKDYDRVITVGSSMGGYAALLFGTLLRAEKAVAIVPQIRIGKIAAEEIGDFRWPIRYAEIDRVASDNDYLKLDNIKLSSSTRYYTVWGAEEKIDMVHEHLINNSQIRSIIFDDEDHGGAARRTLKSKMLEMII